MKKSNIEIVKEQLKNRMNKLEKINPDLKIECEIAIKKTKKMIKDLNLSHDVEIICVNNTLLEYICKDKFQKCVNKCEKAKENMFSCKYCGRE